jgi:hypothetical protein
MFVQLTTHYAHHWVDFAVAAALIKLYVDQWAVPPKIESNTEANTFSLTYEWLLPAEELDAFWKEKAGSDLRPPTSDSAPTPIYSIIPLFHFGCAGLGCLREANAVLSLSGQQRQAGAQGGRAWPMPLLALELGSIIGLRIVLVTYG